MGLPGGTVTFLFTDIEGSTRLLTRLGDRYPDLLGEHGAILREAVTAAGGVEVSTEGDSFFCVFTSAPKAVEAAVAAQRGLARHPWPEGVEVKVRMGLHTGEGIHGGDNYVGLDVHRASRVAEAGHGGQVLLSAATRALVEASLPPGVGLRELGQHRLKDLTRPEELSQLVIEGLPDEFPALRTLEAVRHNLPVQLTSFVGRPQVNEVVRLLADHRLVTLTGPGGTGKTRLSLQVAAESVDRFPDGVFFVPLAAITDPELVPSAVAEVLGVESTGSLADAVTEHLWSATTLLVLDNLEQVLGAAAFVSRLLHSAPGVKVLATSRAPLHLAGEQEYPVPGLALPDPGELRQPEDLERWEATRLFLERARAVRPNLRLDGEEVAAVGTIVTRLAGLPLAIELAAARSKLFSPSAIASRLDHALSLLSGGPTDLPDRQRTLRGAIGWSYDLLEEAPQGLFRLLSVFQGGAFLSQIEEVCGGAELFERLEVLVDHSLVWADPSGEEPRFGMLEMIREYAAERLEESGNAAWVADRHLEAYLRLALEARPHLTGQRRLWWLDRLGADHDNLRAALTRAVAEGDTAAASQLVWSLWRFWQMRGHLHEASRRIQAVLEMPGASALERARSLEAAAGVAYWRSEMDDALRWYREAVDCYQMAGDQAGLAEGLYNLAFVEGPIAGDFDVAVPRMEQARQLFEELGDVGGVGRVLFGVGTLAQFQKQYDRAQEAYLEALGAAETAGDHFTRGWVLRMLAALHLELPDLDGARRYLAQALPVFLDAGDVSAVALHLRDFAVLALREGDDHRALRLMGAVAAVEQVTGSGLTSVALNAVPEMAEVIQRVGEEQAEQVMDEGRRLTIDQAVDLALQG